MMNLLYVVIGLIVLRVADPFKWWVPGPEEVATEFLEAVEYGNYYEAKKYCDEATKLELDLFKEVIDYAEYNFIYVSHVTREGDHATASYELGYDGGFYDLALIRIDREWKVSTTSPLLLIRYEDEETYDGGEYDWGDVEAEVVEELESTSSPTKSDEEVARMVEEFLRKLEESKVK